MNAKDIAALLSRTLPAGLPVYITGAPGVGKSDVVAQAVTACGYDLLIEYAATLDPTDLRGLPMRGPHHTALFAPFGDLRRMLDAEKPLVVFFDDIAAASTSVQAALFQLILARRVDQATISPHVRFLAASNRRQDRAGVGAVLTPLIGRFAAVVELVPEVEPWCSWAMAHDIAPAIIGYVRFRPQNLITELPAGIMKCPSPRSWAQLSALLSLGCDDFGSIAGAIGDGAAGEFAAYLSTAAKLPTWKYLCGHATSYAVPKAPGMAYAIEGLCARYATEDTLETALEIVGRLGEEYVGLFLSDSVARQPGMAANRTFFEAMTAAHIVLSPRESEPVSKKIG